MQFEVTDMEVKGASEPEQRKECQGAGPEPWGPLGTQRELAERSSQLFTYLAQCCSRENLWQRSHFRAEKDVSGIHRCVNVQKMQALVKAIKPTCFSFFWSRKGLQAFGERCLQ
jgi:hypothetical protein